MGDFLSSDNQKQKLSVAAMTEVHWGRNKATCKVPPIYASCQLRLHDWLFQGKRLLFKTSQLETRIARGSNFCSSIVTKLDICKRHPKMLPASLRPSCLVFSDEKISLKSANK